MTPSERNYEAFLRAAGPDERFRADWDWIEIERGQKKHANHIDHIPPHEWNCVCLDCRFGLRPAL